MCLITCRPKLKLKHYINCLNLTVEQKKVLIDEIIMATDINTPLPHDVNWILSEAKAPKS